MKKTIHMNESLEEMGFKIEDPEKIAAFGQRLKDGMKEVRRDTKRRAKLAAERASKIVLNA